MSLFFVLLLLWTPCATGKDDATPSRIVVLVDASNTMGKEIGYSGNDPLGVVRALLDFLDLAFEQLKQSPNIYIRVFGDSLPITDPESCRDSRLVRSWTPWAEQPLRGALDDVAPTGSSPLAYALHEVHSDLGEPLPTDLVLVFLDGVDTCGVDLQSAVTALTLEGEGAEVRFFSFGLTVVEQAVLGDLAPLHMSSTSSQVTSWVLNIIEKRPHFTALPKPSVMTLLTPNLHTLPFRVKTLGFVDPATGEWQKLDVEQTRHQILVNPGISTVVASGDEGVPTRRIERVPLLPGRELELNFPSLDGISLDFEIVSSDEWGQAPRGRVRWSGAPEERLQLVLTRPNALGATWLHSTSADGPDGELEIPLPSHAASLVFQLRRQQPWGDVVVASCPIDTQGRSVELSVPGLVQPDSIVHATWKATAAPGDLLTLVPIDAPLEVLGPTASAMDGSPSSIDVPADWCIYEVRYLDGQSHAVLARAPVVVAAPKAGLLAEASVGVGLDLEVRWWGPTGANDIVTLAEPDMPGLEYLKWAPAADGSPATFVVPNEPGELQIRYVEGGGEVLATGTVALMAIEVVLDVPRSIRAGTRLPVSWTGPNDPSDFLAVVPAGRTVKGAFDLAYVTVGSPTTLGVPFRPGKVEVQYISGATQEILASAAVEVAE